MPAIIVCDCCGATPDDSTIDEAELGLVPDHACAECGELDWEVIEVGWDEVESGEDPDDAGSDDDSDDADDDDWWDD